MARPLGRPRILVGREPERAEIGAALARAAAGDGGLILLVGEPGIGKTRLADEATADARARGFEVVWGRCWEGEAPPAYLPWTQLLRAMPAPRAELAAALAPVLPELGAAAGAGAAAAPGVGEAAGFQLLEAAMEHLAAAAARRPHMLVLDDLHAADEGSLRLLEFVVRALRGRALLVLGSYRDVEARLSPGAARLLARIARDGRSLPLRRLAPDETAALAEAAAGRALPAAVVEHLQRATEGNPLFVGETVELWTARGELDTAARGPSSVSVPGGVEEVIQGRLARLSPPARRALQIVSVLGRDVDARLAGALLASHGIGDPAAALAEAEALGFGAPVGPDRFRLSHAIVRDAIYASLPLPERRRLHLGASQLHEAAAAGAGDEATFEAAHHALAALPEGGAARAVALATRAAEQLARRLAFEAAAAMYERAVAALPVVPPDPLRRCDLLIALARCLASSGAVAAAKGRALDAAALARAAEDGQRLAAAALAYGSEIRIGIVDPALVGLLDEAVAALPAGDRGARPVVMARLAAARQPADDPQGPVALARQAIDLARAGGDPEVLVETLHAALAAMVDYAPAAERLQLCGELRALALARGDRALAMHASARAFNDRLELGDAAGADVELERLDALAREVGHPRYLWRPLLMKAMRAVMTGRFAEADALRAQAAALAARTEDPNLPVVHAMQGYLLALERGDPDELRRAGQATEALLGNFPGESCWRVVLQALGCVRANLLDDAHGEWGRVPRQHPLLASDVMVMTMAAEVAVALGDRAFAAELEPRLRAWAGHCTTMGQMGLAWFGPVERPLGLLAAARGALHEAADWLERAAARARAMAAGPFVARVERELAALRARAGRPAEQPRAETQPALTMAIEGEVWVVSLAGRAVRLRASRGMAMLARLVAEPGRELHALDLGGSAAGEPAVDTGDAGPLLDQEARAAYRARYEDLEETIADAEAMGDAARAAKARAEREQLAAELARGVGLGGRERRAGAAVERARVNVQRRLKDALERIAAADPEMGRHLARAVRTGTFCVYEP